MKKANRPPTGLSPAARKLWMQLHADFELDDAGALLALRSLCQSFDRLEEAREVLRREGLVVTDRFGQTRPHPLCRVEVDSRAGMLAALRALKLAPE